MHIGGQILEDGVIILWLILLHTRRGRSRGWPFRGTGSSNICRMPISQTVVMRSGSGYCSLSLVHGRNSVISKFDPLEKILGGRWGSGVGVIRYVPEGYILPPEKNFPGRPLKICGTCEYDAKKKISRYVMCMPQNRTRSHVWILITQKFEGPPSSFFRYSYIATQYMRN